MIVVADTSPIHYLVQLGEADLLPELYGRVLVPSAVVEELRHPKAAAENRALAGAPARMDQR